MPWRHKLQHKKNYKFKILYVEGQKLPKKKYGKHGFVVSSLEKGKFRSFLKKKKTPLDFIVSRLASIHMDSDNISSIYEGMMKEAKIKAIEE